MDKKDRVVTYRRALWPVTHQCPVTLESLIKQATDKRKTIPDRTVVRHSGQEVAMMAFKAAKSGGYLLHIVADTPGESASVVPTARQSATEIEVQTTSPPSGAEFMDGDAFVYVEDNHVCFCTTGMTDMGIQSYLQAFIKLAPGHQYATRFDLVKMADMKRLTFLKKQGVKEIELSATVSQASAHYVNRKTETIGIAGAVARSVKAVLGKENDVTEDSLRLQLTVRTDRRRRGLALGEKRIKQLAIGLIEDQEPGDEFAIITNSGQRIGPKEIFVKSNVRIEAKGKSLNREPAWKELVDFYKGLKDTDILAD